MKQAGFKQHQSCSNQVLSLTTYIEADLQNRLKTKAVFIDLTAAYNVVWRQPVVQNSSYYSLLIYRPANQRYAY